MAGGEFHYLGTGQSMFNWQISGACLVVLVFIRLLKKRIPYFLVGIVLSYFISAVIHLPSQFNTGLMFPCMFAGMALDMKERGQINRKRQMILTASFLLICAPILILVQYLMSSTISVNSSAIVDNRSASLGAVGKPNLVATVYQAYDSRRGREWRFSDNQSEVKFYSADIFFDSSGRRYSGDQMGLLLAKWANIKPTYRND